MQYMTLEIKVIFDKSCLMEVSPYRYVHTHTVFHRQKFWRFTVYSTILKASNILRAHFWKIQGLRYWIFSQILESPALRSGEDDLSPGLCAFEDSIMAPA